MNGIQIEVKGENKERELMVDLRAADQFQTYYDQVTMIGNAPQIVVFHKRESKRRSGQVIIKYGRMYEEYIKRAIVDHVSSLLKHSSPIIRSEIETNERLGIVVEIPGVYETKLIGENVDASFLNWLFKNNQTSATIKPKLDGNFWEDSPLFQLPALHCLNSSGLTVPIVERFNGQELKLTGFNFSMHHVISVLRRWFSGEAYGNLRLMDIKSRTRVQTPRIRFGNNNNGARLWSLEPFMFEYESLHYSDIKQTMSIDCRQFRPIQRESDGVMAAYRVFENNFQFVVWNKTRDEFVEIN